jgi:hypothetical protein
MRRTVALGAVLLIPFLAAACGGGTGHGVILQRSVVGIDSPVPTPPTTAPAAGSTTTTLPTPEPGEAVVADETSLLANVPFLVSQAKQVDAQETGYRARYRGHFAGADREVTVVVSGERFRIEFEQEIWVYDGGVATEGAVRCMDSSCALEEGDPPVAAVHEALQPLVAPFLMPEAVLRSVRAGGDATISYRTDGAEPKSCAVVEQFDRYVGFSYCVNEAGVVTAFSQGEDYAVELDEWSPAVADADFAPPFPVK